MIVFYAEKSIFCTYLVSICVFLANDATAVTNQG